VRILLTGGTGFLGGHLAECLAAAGHRVRALTRGKPDGGVLAAAGAEVVRGSLEDAASLREAAGGCEVVVHGAGLIRARRPSEYHAVNAGGTLRLLEACASLPALPRRFVLVSSQAAQGPSPGARPLSEEAPVRPVSHYGLSKLRGERIARAFGDRMEVVVVRPPAVYGPRDRETLEFFRLAARGLRLRLGPPDLRLTLVHVLDLVEGIRLAAEVPAARGGTFHLAAAEVLTLGGVMDAMAAALGARGREVTLPRAVLRGAAFLVEHAASLAGAIPALSIDKVRELGARAWVADPSAAAAVLGWRARIRAAEGIAATAAWYRARGWIAPPL